MERLFDIAFSLVGVQQYVDMFTQEEKAILSVRPGITDWASQWNPDEGKILAGITNPDNTYMEKTRSTKLRLQLKYEFYIIQEFRDSGIQGSGQIHNYFKKVIGKLGN